METTSTTTTLPDHQTNDDRWCRFSGCSSRSGFCPAGCASLGQTEAGTTNPFEVGDMALHVGNHLDARPVAGVEGDTIRLQIGTLITEPVPAANYTKVGGTR